MRVNGDGNDQQTDRQTTKGQKPAAAVPCKGDFKMLNHLFDFVQQHQSLKNPRFMLSRLLSRIFLSACQVSTLWSVKLLKVKDSLHSSVRKKLYWEEVVSNVFSPHFVYLFYQGEITYFLVIWYV
ncbi:uncharacterized protein LOC111443303 [Cucurbita moschata]|uniref:Uncharacterized protein LOC111443303 n=1 Tax=Cucurbita moschata TaxID=3662 RepID=A0A6J1F9H4_CUCMO|nr:uncharacterized protein LOC111443303 [Cucurbita moschata]